MTKAERLLYIIDLFRVRRSISLKELHEECGVSIRTIYRDLLSLSEMNIPIYFDNGYRLAKKISLPALNFTENEQELIGLCLKSSPLFGSPRIRKMIKNIELKILSVIPNKNYKQLNKNLVRTDESFEKLSRRDNQIIVLFTEAYVRKDNLSIKLKSSSRWIKGLKPLSMSITGKSGKLFLMDANKKKTYELTLSSIESIRLMRKYSGYGRKNWKASNNT